MLCYVNYFAPILVLRIPSAWELPSSFRSGAPEFLPLGSSRIPSAREFPNSFRFSAPEFNPLGFLPFGKLNGRECLNPDSNNNNHVNKRAKAAAMVEAQNLEHAKLVQFSCSCSVVHPSGGSSGASKRVEFGSTQAEGIRELPSGRNSGASKRMI